jgi:capsule polysaccharide export protein KpsE/RkpR
MRKKMPQQLNIKKFLPILVPLFLAVFYYGLIASDKYVTTASFVIRGAETPKVDMVGMLTGLPGQASQSLEDAYILKDYLLSQDMLGDLRKQLPLEEIFRHEDADYFSRMAAAPSIEDLQKYWQKMVDVTIDKSTGLVTLHVRAFTPDGFHESHRIPSAVGRETPEQHFHAQPQRHTENGRFRNGGKHQAHERVRGKAFFFPSQA